MSEIYLRVDKDGLVLELVLVLELELVLEL